MKKFVQWDDYCGTWEGVSGNRNLVIEDVDWLVSKQQKNPKEHTHTHTKLNNNKDTR